VKHIVLVIILLFIGACTPSHTIQIHQPDPKPVISSHIKRIPIPLQDQGYQHLHTKIYPDALSFDTFLKRIKQEPSWEKKENFLNILKNTPINFARENLLIYRIEVPQGVIIQAVDIPMELNKNINVHIGKEPSPQTNTNKESYYALAYIVDKTIQNITFTFEDGNITLKNR